MLSQGQLGIAKPLVGLCYCSISCCTANLSKISSCGWSPSDSYARVAEVKEESFSSFLIILDFRRKKNLDPRSRFLHSIVHHLPFRMTNWLLQISGCQFSRWGHSSVGRAPALQAGSQGFESPCLHAAALRLICDLRF